MTDTETTPNLKDALTHLAQNAQAELSTLNNLDALEQFRVRFLGRKGEITGILRGLKDVPAAEKPAIGALANEIQDTLTQALETKITQLKQSALSERLKTETIDVTMPGVGLGQGIPHPLSHTIREICDLFAGMGFQVVDDTFSPELETDYYNFDALNFPPDHPARDMQDTFYTDAGVGVLLRSQTSNGQIRYMEKFKPPVRIVQPGRVYRNEQVTSRKNVFFHQLEGLLVDEQVNFSDLKGTLHEFTRLFFGKERKTRFRASFFPFTEPSAEVDVECIFCNGNGCKVCSHLGWLEILGCGMVDPNVLTQVGIDAERYTGFAFGMGIERLAMLKYQIDDIRLFFNNDLRFLSSFNPGF